MKRVLPPVALGLMGALAGAGCESLSDVQGTFEGAIIGGNFVRRCFAPDTTATLQFDTEAAVAVTEEPDPLNHLTTSDGVFDQTPLVPFSALPHDQLSDLTFPGPRRLRTFLLAAHPESGELAGRDAMVVVSILEEGSLEVRIMARTEDGAPACAESQQPPADDQDLLMDPHEWFGVFQLGKK